MIVLEVHTHSVRLDISGPPVLRDLLNLVDAIHADSQQWPVDKLLAVITRIEGRPDILGQALVGEHIAARLAHLSKIATVVPSEIRGSGQSEGLWCL
jgi:hypothetical protein